MLFDYHLCPYQRCRQICLRFKPKVRKVAGKIMSEIKVKILLEVSSNLSNAQVKDLRKVSPNMNLDGNPGRDLAENLAGNPCRKLDENPGGD